MDTIQKIIDDMIVLAERHTVRAAHGVYYADMDPDTWREYAARLQAALDREPDKGFRAMKDDKVTELEKTLYRAQLVVEEAGRIVCPERGEAAGYLRGKIYEAVATIEDAIHHAYLLRGDDDETDQG